MKYTVVWSRTAQDRLAEIWLASTNRDAVSAASDRIEKELARDPARHARHSAGGLLEIELIPLVVIFSISDADCRVAVEDVIELGPLDP